jgi:hypothetical protein
VEVSVDAAALETARVRMRESIAGMKERLDDPLRNVADPERFPQIEDRGACRRCPFRRPCGRM